MFINSRREGSHEHCVLTHIITMYKQFFFRTVFYDFGQNSRMIVITTAVLCKPCVWI